jgi:protein-disulfide isomerase
MKKKFIWGGAIILVILVIALLLVKLEWKKNPEKSSSDLATVVKAESFAPASQPTISDKEKIVGSIKAPVKVLVYEDYSNVFSADNSEVIKKLETDFGDKVVVAVRPYVSREKPISISAAIAVECASDQGKWQDMRTDIFNAVKNNNLSVDGIKAAAGQIGLDQTKFGECLTSPEKQGIMLQVAEDAKKFSVYGAPTIFVNNELVVGARPYDDYLDESGAKVEGLKSLVERQIK